MNEDATSADIVNNKILLRFNSTYNKISLQKFST